MSRITGTTKLVAVMGSPVKHTLSPLMQNRAIEALGLDWVYLALDTPVERLEEAFRGLQASGFVGLNLTLPHKIEAVAFMDRLDDDARAIGAVNTVHFTDEGMVGYNTDHYGYTRTVEVEGEFSFKGAEVLQIGAGGVGRAMAAGAAAAGAGKVHIYNRTAEKAAVLCAELAENYPKTGFVAVAGDQALATAATKVQLIANATSLGMKDGDPLPLPAECITSGHVVFDTVYAPPKTSLLKAAEACGARAVGGLGMLARQGAKSLAIWSGKQPDEGLMLNTLREHIR